MNRRFGKVAVLFGGKSAEREISLLSGHAVLAALEHVGVDAHAFDTAGQDLHTLKEEGYQRAFIALHGRGGEDGTVQGVLELMGIPYTGSGVMASALAMDKWRTKMIWQASGLPTPRYELLSAASDWDAVVARLGLPIFVKPVREGSSIGMTRVVEGGQLRAAWELAARYDELVMAEALVSGEEFTAPFLGEQALPLVKITAPDGNYDYQNKYFRDETRYDCPSGLPAAQEEALRELALKAAKVLGCRGWGRTDLILTAGGKPYLLETNTAPGMTGHSLVPMSAKAVGLSFEALCLRILEGARLG
jgi:D-alanine-D-alanine ligase